MEVGNSEFDRLLNQKYHNQLIAKLDEMLKEVGKEVKSGDVNLDTDRIEELLTLINNSSNKLPDAIIALSDVITTKLSALQVERPTKWEFTIERDSDGFIDIVKAVSTNNKI